MMVAAVAGKQAEALAAVDKLIELKGKAVEQLIEGLFKR
jgi:hypothetical protein